MRTRDVLLALSVPLMWGSNFAVVRIGLETIPPFLLTAMRFAVVCACLLPFVKRPRGREWSAVAGISLVFGALHFGTLILALREADASRVVVLYQAAIPLTVVFSWLFLSERFDRFDAVALALAVAGLSILSADRTGLPSASLVLALVSAVALALSNVLVRRFGSLDPWTLNAWIGVFSVPQFVFLSLIFEESHIAAFTEMTSLTFAVIMYMSIVSGVLGFGFWYLLLRRYEATAVAPFLLLTPVFGIFFGVILLNESLTPNLVLGCTVLLVGLVCSLSPRRHSQTANPGGCLDCADSFGTNEDTGKSLYGSIGKEHQLCASSTIERTNTHNRS